MRRDVIDFAVIQPNHLEIHDELLNWARWCRGGHSTGVHPMFRQYRDNYFQAAPPTQECDTLAALATQRAYAKIPEKHRWVLNWSYCRPFIPVLKVRQALGLTTPALAEMLHDARSMMRNLRHE